MKTFKEIIGVLDRTFGTFLFGFGISRLLMKDYKVASYILFIVSILFIIGYFAERWID